MEQAAVGGLVEPANVVEAMMLGAKICEFSSGTLWKGWNLIEASIDFLKKYIYEQGYHSLEDFRGLGTQYIRPVEEVDWGLGKLTATVDPTKCKGCGICANNLCWAMRIEDAKAVVKEKNCGACSLCIAICPNKAVSLTEAKVPREEEEIYAEIMGQ
jgi:dihydropyrimidine dehydrogenase (NAD+) subunit PreA